MTEHTTNPDSPAIEALLTSALEHKPSVSIPPDFAASMAFRVHNLPVPAPRRASIYGQLAAGISFAFLLFAMFALAPWTQPSFTSLCFDLELALLAQMLGLGAWQFLRHRVRPELSF